MKLIYIVEPEDIIPSHTENEYVPNFTIPSHAIGGAISAGIASGSIAKSILLGVPLLSLPTALVVAAASTSPLISQMLTKDKTAELPADIENAERNEMEVFLRKNAITESKASELGFQFPPGHPVIGQAYKLHPLASLNDVRKQDVYIPQDKYDSLLLEEREAELLKLLVFLGATKIALTKRKLGSNSTHVSGSVSTSANVIAEAGINTSISERKNNHDDNTRIFELSGKPWKYGDKLDRSQFAWVGFEPSWEALIVAREIGGCAKATLEIRENTSFSSDKSLAAKVKAKIYGGDMSLNAENFVEEEKCYLVQAEFIPFNCSDN